MFCTSCGSELSPQGQCPRCASSVPADASLPTGDAFVAAPPEPAASGWKTAAFVVLSLPLFALVLFLNYLKALRWAGVMNAESFGYMIGGILVSVALGFLTMFLVRKARGRKVHPASKALGIAGVAVLFSFIGLAQEIASRPAKNGDTNHQIGDLLKEAAGTKPTGKDAEWTDSVLRDFFRDILEMNQKYSAEAAALDSSAIKDLYSVESYRGKTRMEKTVAQLQAALAVDEKYASLDPILKKLADRIASADVSETEKQQVLQAMKASAEKSLAPRNELLRTEEAWMKSTIDLYNFTIAHSSEYSVKNHKLYFRNDAARESFTSQQSQSIVLHKDFLKAKAAFEQSRKDKMQQVGVSPSDLTPEQLGKTQ